MPRWSSLPATATARLKRMRAARSHLGRSEGPPGFLRENAISWATMDRPQRLITGVAIGQLLAAALSLAVRPWMGPTLAITLGDQRQELPIVVFGVSLISLVLAYCYLLTGALHAPWRARLLFLALFTCVVAVGPAVWSLGLVVGGARPGSVVLLRSGWLATLYVVAGIWGWGLALSWIDRHAEAHPGWRRPRWTGPMATFGIVLALIGSHFVLLWWASAGGPGALPFPLAVQSQMAGAIPALLVVLLAAGSDFAELGQELASWVARTASRPISLWPLALLTALTAVAGLAHIWIAQGPSFGPAPIGSLVLAAGAITWVAYWGRVGRWPALHVPPSAPVVLAALVLIAGGVAQAIAAAGHEMAQPVAEFQVYRHGTEASSFSVAYPAGWQVSATTGPGTELVYTFDADPGASNRSATFGIITSEPSGTDRGPGADQQDLLRSSISRTSFCRPGPCTFTAGWAEGPWQATRGTTQAFEFRGWLRFDGDRLWILLGACRKRACNDFAPVIDRMAASWQPDLAAKPPEAVMKPGLQRLYQLCPNCLRWGKDLGRLLPPSALVLGVAMAGIGLLLIRQHRYRPGAMAAAGIFGFSAGIWSIAVYAQNSPFFSAQLSATVAALVTVVWLAVGRRWRARTAQMLAPLFMLTVALQFLFLLSRLYSLALSGSEGSLIVQAVVLLVALGWDLAMSGKNVTNVDGERFRRPVRMLLYFGYTMLVSTTVLFYGSLTSQATHGPIDQFEPDKFVRYGIIGLAVPLLITSFVISTSRVWSSALNLKRPGFPS